MQDKRDNTAAIYIRVSTEKTAQKDSPEHQRGICEEKADLEGLDVKYVYEDRSSGTSIYGREDMKQLMNDAKEGLFDTILFASLSRFARNLKDALTLREFFVDALGIRLIAIDENYDSKVDKDSAFKFELHGMMNENLSKTISLSSKRGIRQSAKKGNFTGSHAPFGYEKVVVNEVKTLAIVKEKADVVKQIFDLYTNHKMGEKKITEHLNNQNIPSPKGGVWGITTIQRILQNEAYCGINVYRKYKVKTVYDDVNTLEDRKKRLVQRDKEKWERNEKRNWKPIIEDEIFKAAQELRLKRGGGKRGGIRNIKVNPFSGLVKCSHCGSNFVSMKSGKVGKNGQEYRYLICSSRRRMGTKGCENNLWAPLDEFKAGVMQEIKLKLEEKINIDEVSASLEIQTPNVEKANMNQRKKLEAQLKQNRMLIMKIRKEFNLKEIEDVEQYNFEKEQFEFEKETYENEIKVIKQQLNKMQEMSKANYNIEVIREQVNEGLKRLVSLDFEAVDELQLILKQVIEEITLDINGEVKIRTPLGNL